MLVSKQKRTKIVATIGPASEEMKTILELIKRGMNVARLNFSHGSYESHSELIRNIRGAAKALKTRVAILADLQGPRVRIGKIFEEGIKLRIGDEIILTCSLVAHYGLKSLKSEKIPISYNQLFRDIKKGERILIDDGLIELKVEKIRGVDIICRVARGGLLTSGRGMNFPQTTLNISPITVKDKKDLAFALDQGIDYVALSFVTSSKDIKNLRCLIKQLKPIASGVKIIAKIEKHEAVENFEEILSSTDGVMIARGDLGIELAAEKVPLLQKEIIAKCLKAYKPVIVATQMLDSMVRNPRPTRAEVSDVANAVIDHADALMLSQETATCLYPKEAVVKMADVIKEIEASRLDDYIYEDITDHKIPIAAAVCRAAQELAATIGAKLILVTTVSGFSARAAASHRPEIRVAAITPNEQAAKQLALIWGVTAFTIAEFYNSEDLLYKSLRLIKKEKLVKNGDKIVVVSGLKHKAAGDVWSNSISVFGV